MKAQGKTLNELIAYKTKSLYGDKVNFNNLSVSQKNSVYSTVVQSAGKSNHEVNIKMQRFSGAGRGLIFLSLAVAVYQIYEAEDRVLETQRQLAISTPGLQVPGVEEYWQDSCAVQALLFALLLVLLLAVRLPHGKSADSGISYV